MKKTLLLLLTLGAIASGADTKEQLWSIDFTTLNRTSNGQAITFGDYTFEVWDGTLSSAGITSNYTPATTTTNEAGESVSVPAQIDRVHIVGDTGVTWGDNFAVEVVFTLPDGYDKAGNWPAIFNMYGNGNNDNLRFGPYVGASSYGIDGVNSTALVKPDTPDWTAVTLTTGEEHTALLSVYEGAVTLTIDGAVAAKATLTESDGETTYYGKDIPIDNMLIGGHVGDGNGPVASSAWNMDVTVSSLTMYKLVPEPTTATLSLLALAGLAARRRRK